MEMNMYIWNGIFTPCTLSVHVLTAVKLADISTFHLDEASYFMQIYIFFHYIHQMIHHCLRNPSDYVILLYFKPQFCFVFLVCFSWQGSAS